MVRVQLPYHLRNLAQITGDVDLQLDGSATVGDLIDAVEERYPMLTGTIREHSTGKRRAYVRFFAGGKDISHNPMTMLLPASVVQRKEPFIILGAISGG